MWPPLGQLSRALAASAAEALQRAEKAARPGSIQRSALRKGAATRAGPLGSSCPAWLTFNSPQVDLPSNYSSSAGGKQPHRSAHAVACPVLKNTSLIEELGHSAFQRESPRPVSPWQTQWPDKPPFQITSCQGAATRARPLVFSANHCQFSRFLNL